MTRFILFFFVLNVSLIIVKSRNVKVSAEPGTDALKPDSGYFKFGLDGFSFPAMIQPKGGLMEYCLFCEIYEQLRKPKIY